MSETPTRIPAAQFDLERFPPGTRCRVEVVVEHMPNGTDLALPVLVVRGNVPGKTLLAIAGVHGDEFEGPLAIQDTYEALQDTRVRGTFVGIPIVNGPAFAAGSRDSGWDCLNLARLFPGDPLGAPSERLAHALQTRVFPQSDLLVDIHSAGNGYAIHPLAGYLVSDGSVGKIQREAAVAFGLDLVWGTPYLPGRTLSGAAVLNVPAIYVELEGEGRCRPEQLGLARRGLRNLLAYMGLCEGDFPVLPPRWWVETTAEGEGHLQAQHPSQASGLFLPQIGLWHRVTAGEPIGFVRHPDGRIAQRVSAERSGRILFLRTFPKVDVGDCLATILPIDERAKGFQAR